NRTVGTGDITYKWDFGDGNTSTEENPVNNYQNAGVYTVKLIATNSYGCSDILIKPNAINIGIVKADFKKQDVACAGAAFQLTNSSNPSSFVATSWDFGDGTSSNEANPLKIYEQPGTYQVKMVTDFGSCQDSVTKAVTVLPKPVADFTSTNNINCKAPLDVLFNNTTNDAVSYEWNFGDSSTSSTLQNPLHTYLALGKDTVTLIATNSNGCRDTIVKPDFVKIIPPKIAVINNLPVKGCVPVTITPVPVMQDSLPADSYFWDFGDGTTSTQATPTHTYTIPGSYNVKLIINVSGCTDSLTMLGAVKGGIKPVADFAADLRNICASQTVNFADSSTGATITEWLWNFGDGTSSIQQNPMHQYRDTGYFPVSLIASNYGCNDTIEKRRYIYVKPPVAIFDTAFLCSTPFEREFIDKSIGAKSWEWDFGDGSPKSTNQQVSHTYSGPGIYPVSLAVTNGACSDTLKKDVVIIKEEGKLEVDIPVSCIHTDINFTVNNINPANIRSYAWYFNGITQPASPAVVNPVTTSYTTAGSWPAAAIITDILNCPDTLDVGAPITIYGPKADFESSVGGECLGNTVAFNDSSTTDGSHPITTWWWNFGDGINQTYTSPPFAHQYNTEGLFDVTLAVTDRYGCRDSLTKPRLITIRKPVAKFAQSDTLVCPNTAVTFRNQTSGLLNTYLWQFGDSTTSTLVNPIPHTYKNEGNYQVKLKVIDEFGCTDSTISSINVVKTAAGFLMSDSFVLCPPLTVNFTNTSVGFSELIWDFDDEARSTLINPSHIFTTPGTFTVKILARNNSGCSDTATKKIVVKGPNGDFNYTPLNVCMPGKIDFTANVETAVKYFWNYQEGSIDSTQEKISSHVYTTPGTYLPQLIVEDSTGCRFAIMGKDSIVVNEFKTNILADKNILCDSGIIHFSNNIVSSSRVSTYLWSFDDSTTSTLSSPEHRFAAPGNYNVSLKVTSEGGCTDSTAMMIKVTKTSFPSIVATDSTCAGASIRFSALLDDTSTLRKWNWNFGNGKTSSSQNPHAQFYNSAGSYNVSLSVTNSSGCVSTVTKPIVINPVPSLKVSPNTSICKGNEVPLFVSGADSYTWMALDNNLSCTNCANPTANPSDNITYRVQGTTAAGCSSVDSVAIKVVSPLKVSVAENIGVCNGKSVQLIAQGAPRYIWTPSAGLSSVSISNPVATPTTTTTYQVIGYDPNGTMTCINDTASVTVTVFAPPVVDLGPDKTTSIRSNVVLNPVISNDVTNLRWTPATALSCTDCAKPEFIATNNISYKLRVENEHCSAEDQINIVVTYDNRVIFIPNAFSPNGDGINDVFFPTGANASFVKSMTIFNRWGKQIFVLNNFRGNDPAYGWKGTWNGIAAQVGVYYYIIEFIGPNNKLLQYKVYVTLLK
ncbi:MAG TPA: PKD domain-containing protein, partial [Segetibacter sp.]|nr:PKD domain-containing protein [Segetibacter sp.]